MAYEYGLLFPVAEIKAVGDVWEVSGRISTFGNTDRGGDVVMPGAFDRTLREIDSLPLLLGHDMGALAGASKELRVDDQGLFARFELSRGPTGLDAHENLKVGALKAFSIGYVARDAEFTSDGIRKLIEVDLIEASLLPQTMPMNTQAVITGFKTFDINDDVPFDVLLKQVIAGIDRGATGAEALWARRLSDGREPQDVHIEAVKQMLAAVEAAGGRLQDLLAPRPEAKAEETEAPAGDPQPAPSAPSAISLRLHAARRRLERRGDLERSA